MKCAIKDAMFKAVKPPDTAGRVAVKGGGGSLLHPRSSACNQGKTTLVVVVHGNIAWAHRRRHPPALCLLAASKDCPQRSLALSKGVASSLD